MKILPISTVKQSKINKTNFKNNSNFFEIPKLNNSAQISFKSNFDIAYKAEANVLKFESLRNQQIADKQLKKAQELYSSKQRILDEAQEIKQEAYQYQSELFEMIQFSEDGSNFTLAYNPNEEIDVKRSSDNQVYQITQKINDNKVKRTQIAASGIVVYVDDLKTKTTDAFVYDVPTFEIDYCARTVKAGSSGFFSQKRYAFENNELKSYSEGNSTYFSFKNNSESNISYIFEDGELCECNLGLKQDARYLNISEVYYFSPEGNLEQSCIDVACDMNAHESLTGVELRFDKDEKLDVCMKNEHTNVYNRKNCDKIFEYEDGELKEVLLGAYIKAPGMVDTKRVYQYEHNTLKYGYLNLRSSGADYICGRKIEF